MREAVALLSEEGAVDELGLGRIRDAFSERIFPGTSVLWQRARYLFFVPWVYDLLAAGHGKPGSPEQRARKLFLQLATELAAVEEPGAGVVGASGVDVKQTPDVLMWAALRAWGVRIEPGRLAQVRERAVSRSGRRSGLEDGDETRDPGPWLPAVLALRSPDFPNGSSLRLERSEAELLRALVLAEDAVVTDASARARAAQARRESLLAHMVRRRELPPADSKPWEVRLAGASPELKTALHHAGCFADVIHGARIRYAGLVADAREDEALAKWVREESVAWISQFTTRRGRELRTWGKDLRGFWRLVRDVNPNIGREMRFVEQWTAAALADPAVALKSWDTALLVIAQEQKAKGAKKARLTLDGGVGRDADARPPALLTFRWAQGRQIAKDILEGLER